MSSKSVSSALNPNPESSRSVAAVWGRFVLRAFAVAGLVFAVAACSSKKKTTDESALAGGDAAADSSPMSFDAQGSDSGKIDGLYTISFDYDKANLSKETRDKLRSNAEWMKARPNMAVQIEGHCDNRGSIEYNLALGERRAKAVREYMVSLGIPARRLTVISYGKERLLDSGDSEAAHARNRRANFLPLAK